jgi:cyclopropane fatty-acyl-phospholipid synthase-like methyltransferase
VRNKSFDPLVPKPGSSDSRVWNGIAEGWHRWIPRMREWYAPATSLLLYLARIGPGSRVLDVAAGDGDQSLAAATRVGSSGYVLAIDPAGSFLPSPNGLLRKPVLRTSRPGS